MFIEKIEWLDKEEKEAILEVASGENCVTCFSHPCAYNIGDILNEPLECLNTDNIITSDTYGCFIEKGEDTFKYIIRGRLKDKQNGYVEVSGFLLHIDENRIPNDVETGMYIQFAVSRIDVW